MSSTPTAIFVSPLPCSGETISITGDELHYLQRVVRVRQGERLRILDGSGGAIWAVVRQLDKRSLRLLVEGEIEDRQSHDSALQLVLLQCVTRSNSMDLILQKATELGVHEVIPVLSENNRERKRSAKNQLRWQRIVREAVRQCDRRLIPVVHEPVELAAWLEQAPEGIKLFFRADATVTLHQLFQHTAQPGSGTVCLLIGPEGGLSDGEAELLTDSGFTAVSLGPRILRAETASIVACALVQAGWGDLR